MDALEIVRILEKRQFDHDEAIQLAEAINGKSGLATKEDINKLEASINKLENRIIKLETSMNWIKGIGFVVIALLIKLAFFS